MDNRKRRVGRPKTPPRTGPLVLENDRGREAVEVQLNSETARELAEYAGWVELSGTVTTAEATFKTVEYALREVFRRDRVWQERRRTRERQKGVEPIEKAEPATSPSPAARPVSLPPPVSAGATRVGPDRPI